MQSHSGHPFHPWCFADTCDVRCARKKTEKRFRKTIRTLRKTVSRDQFRIRLSGTDHEVARKAPRPSEPQQACGVGQLHPGVRCGELGGRRGWWGTSCVPLLCWDLELAGVGVHPSRREQGWVCRSGGAAGILPVNLLLAIEVLQSRARAHCTALQLMHSLQ